MQRSKGFWKLKQNQLNFLNDAAKIYQLKTPSDWGKVTTFQIKRCGGSTLLHLHKNSLFNTLTSVFPEIEWKKEWFSNVPNFPLGHWKDRQNQRKFLNQIAKTLNIKEPKDWGQNMMNKVIELGGGSLLRRFRGSLFETLEYAFPETKWERKWFPRSSLFPRRYWESVDNQRQFLEQFSIIYGVKEPQDWSRISLNLLRQKGGLGLLKKYNFSLLYMLQQVYPEFSWRNVSFSIKNPSLPQKSVIKKTVKYFQQNKT